MSEAFKEYKEDIEHENQLLSHEQHFKEGVSNIETIKTSGRTPVQYFTTHGILIAVSAIAVGGIVAYVNREFRQFQVDYYLGSAF